MSLPQQVAKARAGQQPHIARQVRLVVVAGRQCSVGIGQPLPAQGFGQQAVQAGDPLHLFRRQAQQRLAAALQLARAQTQGRGGLGALATDGQAQPLMVTVGESNGSETEVTGNELREGMQVVTGQLAARAQR